MLFITIPAVAAITTRMAILTLVNIAAQSMAMYIIKAYGSLIALLKSLTMEVKISTHTQARIPAKASLTISSSEKFEIKAAIMLIITTEGKTTPNVAKTPPMDFLSLYPTKVAVFTAMMPGVH